MGSTMPKLIALAALLEVLAIVPDLARPPAPGSFTVMGVEGGQMAHWAFSIQNALWPATSLLIMAIGLEGLRRIADALEGRASLGEEDR